MIEELEEFIAEGGYSPRTAEKHRDYMARLLQWLRAGGIELEDLKPSQYREYLDSRPWNDSTKHNAYYVLRPFMRWKFGEDHPLLKLNLRRPPPTPQRTLTLEQVDQLIECLGTDQPVDVRNLAIVSLALDTGLRASELCRLKLTDVDLSKRSYHVLAKGNKVRSGYFSKVTGKRLQKWLKLREKVANADARTFFTSVGGTKPGTPLTRYGLGCIFRYMTKKSGIKVSPHDLRRTFCVLSLLNGAPTRLVQIGGGWSNLNEVERYSQALDAAAFAPYFPTQINGS